MVASLGLTLAGAVAARTVLTATTHARAARRQALRHAQTARLVGQPQPALQAVVVEHAQPAAYCVAGRQPTVILTTSAVQALDPGQLARPGKASERVALAGRRPEQSRVRFRVARHEDPSPAWPTRAVRRQRGPYRGRLRQAPALAAPTPPGPRERPAGVSAGQRRGHDGPDAGRAPRDRGRGHPPVPRGAAGGTSTSSPSTSDGTSRRCPTGGSKKSTRARPRHPVILNVSIASSRTRSRTGSETRAGTINCIPPVLYFAS